jgi:phosphoserine phosphatase
VTVLNSWMAQHQASLEGSFFYSDSANDIPLLDQVDHPVAVDPDRELQNYAEKRGWKVISLR